MQPSVSQLVALGRLPVSEGAHVEELQRFQDALQGMRKPLTDDEARALVQCFGTDDCFGLAWSLLHAIETAPGWPLKDVLEGSEKSWIVRMRQRASL